MSMPFSRFHKTSVSCLTPCNSLRPILFSGLLIALGLLPSVSTALTLNEAVEKALANNPDLKSQVQELAISKGHSLQSIAPFDWTVAASILRSHDKMPLTNSDGAAYGRSKIHTDTTSYNVSAQKLLPFGWTVGGDVGAESNDQTLNSLQGVPQQNLLTLGINLQIPLLRGAGGGMLKANRDASELAIKAAQYELRAKTSTTLLQVLIAYWNYRAEEQLLGVANSAIQRSQQLMDDVQLLIAADELPRSDLLLLEASHADRVYAQLAAKQSRDRARDALGTLMGLSASATLSLDAPEDALPFWQGDEAGLRQILLHKQAFVDLAKAKRPEVAMLAAQLDAAQLRVDAARKDLRPQLDLHLSSAYKNASEGGNEYGFVGDRWDQGAGPSISIGLRYEIPVARSGARGQLQTEMALKTQIQIAQHEQLKASAVAVSRAIDDLDHMVQQEQRLARALNLYESIVKQEVEKQKLGFSTLIDVVTVEDRYQNARTQYIQHQLALAQAFASLRYQTATLIRFTEEDESDMHAVLNVSSFGNPAMLLNLL